jgi:hypothetical protein
MKSKYFVLFLLSLISIHCNTRDYLTAKDLVFHHYNQLKDENFADFQNLTIIPRDYYRDNYAFFFYASILNNDSSRYSYSYVLEYDSIIRAPVYKEKVFEKKYNTPNPCRLCNFTYN